MKKIKFICFLLFVSIAAIAQTPFPSISKKGSASTLEKSLGGIKADSLFINAVYLDTTAANRSPYNKTYIGGQIYTTSDSSIWLWQGKWIKAKGSSGGGGLQGLASVTAIDSVTTRKVTVSKFMITDLREFENNDSAVANGLQNGDQYRLPYNDGAYRVATAKVPPITMGFTVGAGDVVDFNIIGSYSEYIDWGDGVIEPNLISPFTHTYVNAGNYIAKIIYNNHVDISSIYTDIASLSYLSSYSQPYLPFVNITRLTSGKLSTSEVNKIIIQLNKYGYAGSLQINGQTPPAPPSGLGITAKNAIIARGGSVITD